MNKTIAVVKGDGVGPEVIDQAVLVLKRIEKVFGHNFTFVYGDIGVDAFKKTGMALPRETLNLCEVSDAILFGTIGDPKFDYLRVEESLLQLRAHLGLFSNIRPIYSFPQIIDISPLKKDIVKGIDFVFVRELTGGLYYGKRKKTPNLAFDTCEYTKEEILRVTSVAFDLARKRKKKVTLVDKANVLDTSRLWREVFASYAKKHSEIQVEYMYVDNAAMQIIKNPINFDVILTENMFGDILSDEASVLTGSLGMIPSASLGQKTALYEPIHGSYPKAKGLNVANPIASILSAAMMLELSFNLIAEKDAIYNAVSSVLASGYGTKDILPKRIVGTVELGQKVCLEIN